jgi:hypothetical protein
VTDRELLELAAKAAGVDANEWCEPGQLLNDKGGFVQFIGLGHVCVWNPLTDDGDALRLAVRLELSVWQAGSVSVADHDRLGPKMREEHSGDPCAATRRAIVRAAAEIGKEQPK